MRESNKGEIFQKKLKKGVDKGGSVWYTSGALLRKRRRERSLKIEQLKDSNNDWQSQTKNLVNILWNSKSKKKKLEKSSDKGIKQECIIYSLSESLILAQDERWRRA